MQFTFTLRYRLADHHSDSAAVVERLGEGGCDDALVGTGRPGRIALEFTREAQSARVAVRSALADVRRALPGVRLVEAWPDFVGLSDVADIVGVSRQNLRKLMLNHPGSFPSPVHEGTTSIWHLAGVLRWLEARAGYELPPGLVQVAVAVREVNAALASGDPDARPSQALLRLVAPA